MSLSVRCFKRFDRNQGQILIRISYICWSIASSTETAKRNSYKKSRRNRPRFLITSFLMLFPTRFLLEVRSPPLESCILWTKINSASCSARGLQKAFSIKTNSDRQKTMFLKHLSFLPRRNEGTGRHQTATEGPGRHQKGNRKV